VAEIADHGQGLEEDLGQEHRRTDVEVHAAFQFADQAAEHPEIMVAGPADGRAVGRWGGYG
jgi:hypothetical protein